MSGESLLRKDQGRAFSIGVALQAKGRLLEAEAQYQQVLRTNPDDVEALNAMGTLAMAAGKPDFAIGFFERALKGAPSDFRFLNNLGNVLVSTGRTEEALPHLERALRQRPSSYELLCNVGGAYRKMGVAAKGLPHLRRAVKMRPNQHQGLLTLADILLALGHYDEAETVFQRVLDTHGPKHLALHGIATARKQTVSDSIGDKVSAALAEPGLPDDAAARLHYAAAKVAMDQEQHEAAFEELRLANELSPKRFDERRHNARLAALKSLFSRQFITTRAPLGSSSDRPIFIVGMPRSGTSLTEQILASHPDIVGAGELTYMHTIANRFFYGLGNAELFVDRLRRATASELQSAASEYLSKIAYFSEDAPYVTDKMPHNFMMVGLIAILFPRAKIIFCRRDAMDNCFSIYANMLNESHSYGSDLSSLGRYYRSHLDLMRHWMTIIPDQILEVDYESIVSDLEGTARRMLGFLDLPWDAAVLNYYANDRAVSTISKWQVRQPIYHSSVGRWRVYERQLAPLRDALGDLAERPVSGLS